MALNQKYCNPTGSGAHTGLSAADAWSFTEALAGVAAGDIVNMLAGSGNTYDNGTNTRTFTTPGTTIAPIWWRGYKTTPGDMDNDSTGVPGSTIPALTVTTGSFNPVGNFQNFSKIDFSGSTLSASFRMFNASSMQAGVIFGCRFRLLAGATAPCVNIGGNNMAIIGCYFSSAVAQVLCQQSAGNYQLFLGNYFTGGSVGLQYTTGPLITIDYNVFDAIQGDAIQFTTGHCNMVGNSIYAPTGHGITWSGTPAGGCYIANNHFENVNVASKAAINNASGTPTAHIHPVNNSYFGCTANVAGQGDNLSIWDYGTLAGSGFVNAPGHDFTPSALLLAKGFPGQLENLSLRGYMSIGALQAQVPVGGGGGGGYLVGGGTRPMSYYGDFATGKTVRIRFNTINTSSVPTTLANGAIIFSKDGADVSPSGGVTLSVDVGSVVGRNHVVIDTSVDVTTFTAGSEYAVRLSGTSAVGTTSVVGVVVGEFSIQNRYAPVTAAAPSAAAIDSQLSGTHGAGSWLSGSSSAPTAAQNAAAVWQDADDTHFNVANSIGLFLSQASTLTDIVTAVQNTPMAEDYNADGAAASLAQALYVIMQRLMEFTTVDTGIQVNRLDGSTPAYQLTLNAIPPSGISRTG